MEGNRAAQKLWPPRTVSQISAAAAGNEAGLSMALGEAFTEASRPTAVIIVA